MLYMNEKWTPEKLSYLAGIIDGEGSVLIEIQSQNIAWSRKCDYYSLRLVITNTHLPMMEWVKENFGGTIVKRTAYPNTKQCYKWNIFSHNAAEILKSCQQYMIIKKPHAEIFLKFAETMTKANSRLSDELLAHRKDMYIKLKQLIKTN